MAALGEAAAQADMRAPVARGGDAAPVDRQRLRQPAGDVHGQRAVWAHADGRDADRGRRGGRGREQREGGGDDGGQGGAHPGAG
jgi:hypothetical protein